MTKSVNSYVFSDGGEELAGDMTDNPSVSHPSSLRPLIKILSGALVEANVDLGMALPQSVSEFSHWYLEAIKALELAVANQGQQQPIYNRDIQMLCRCVLSATNLSEAIRLTIEFSDMLHPRNGKQAVDISSESVVFSLDTLRKCPTPISSLVDITGLHAFYQLFQWLIGIELPLTKVRIGLGQRDDVLPFLRLFNAPVLAVRNNYSFEFPVEFLQLPVVRTNKELSGFIAHFPCEVFGSAGNDIMQQVEALITAAVQQMLPIPTLRQLTQTLGIPESTFRRRLHREGTSFRELRESCLQEMASRYLRRDDLSIEQISRQLGFSDGTSFRRAFKAWTSMSPSAWRNQNQDV